jgi:cobalt-precorrin 5A hydrolase
MGSGKPEISIVAFTKKGREKGNLLSSALACDYSFRFYRQDDDLDDFVKAAFERSYAIIFISAAGIAVRKIAPHIRSKDRDPAVLVMDDGSRHVISLLSGHLGGANELTIRVSKALGAAPVITTATDINRKFAVDLWAKEEGLIIGDIGKVKFISSALLADEKVGLVSDVEIKGELPEGIVYGEENITRGIYIGIRKGQENLFDETLVLIPKTLVIGLGTRRGVKAEALEAFILDTLEEEKIDIRSVKELASIDIKKDESCIKNFAEKYGLGIKFYKAEELMAEMGDFDSSNFVLKTTGADNVCERAAHKASGGGEKIRGKTRGDGMTLALYNMKESVTFER